MLEILLKSEWMSRWLRCKSMPTILAMTRPNAFCDNRQNRFYCFLQITGSEQQSSRSPGFISFGVSKRRINCDHSRSKALVRRLTVPRRRRFAPFLSSHHEKTRSLLNGCIVPQERPTATGKLKDIQQDNREAHKCLPVFDYSLAAMSVLAIHLGIKRSCACDLPLLLLSAVSGCRHLFQQVR
jgi:hypothetical protein